MSEPSHVFHRPRTMASTENVHGIVDQPPSLAEGSRRRQQSQQPRQLLSCTKCRERKVKCDRTKPCSACCARGAPRECYFIAEGGDYAPIQQSYELRKLRAENLRLKERLRACKISIEDDESDLAASPDSQLGERPSSSAHKRRAARQRRFQGSEWSDSIYFGSPGLANVLADFASINFAPLSPQSLAHLMPRGPDMYTTKTPPPHPFATLFKATPADCIPQLLSCLPSEDELLEYLTFFETRVHVCAFPHVPMEITRSEVERFLSDPEKNSQMCPDMLALLFAALALGSQYSAWDKSGGQWKADTMQQELQKGNVYVAAAMQALRMASFMHKPTLLGIQALIMIGPFLTNSGRFLDAWTLFGTTIRLAHSIGLHRHPKYLDPAPPTQRECSIRQTLWWWMLHMDQEYSMTLGRPLGISGIGDCPPPHELTTDPRMLRFGEFVNHFTVLARQILSSDRLSNSKIDEFTDLLKGLLDTMPEMLQFDESWLNEGKEIPEWPLGTMAAGWSHLDSFQRCLEVLLTHLVFYCKTHTYLILLNRQRMEKQSAQPVCQSASQTKTQPPGFHPVNLPASTQASPTTSPKPSLRGRSLVLSSSEDLLTAFLFFHARIPAALICWTLGQQAFNSCMILLLDAMETGDLGRIGKVEKAYVDFLQLQNNGVHELASMAVERVSWGLAVLGRMKDQPRKPVKVRPVASNKGGNPACDVEMQGAVGNEAIQGSRVVHDTVMGNTGMLLLEDPGLQSFVPEAFAPLTWVIGRGGELEAMSSTQMQIKEEQRREQGERGEEVHFNDAKPNLEDERVCDARSSEQMQGTLGSAPGSAPMRYATFSTAPSQVQTQPQGLTSPTSPPASAVLMQDQNFELHGRPAISAGHHQLPHPHLRHHSYPSLHQPPPSPMAHPFASGQRPQTDDPTAGVSSRGDTMQAESRGNGWERLDAAGLDRMIPRLGASQPFLQPLPELTATPSVAALLPTAPTGSPNVHPSWAARPAAPMSSVSDPALSFPHMSNRSQAIPDYIHQHSPVESFQYTFPFHISSALNESAQTPTTQAEQTELESWRRWVGSHGAE